MSLIFQAGGTPQQHQGAMLFDGVSVILGGNTNNLVPNDPNFTQLNITPLTPLNLTGLTGASQNRFVRLVNAGAVNLTLISASGLSLAANQFSLGGNIILVPGACVELVCLIPALGWNLISSSVAGGGGGGGGSTPTFASSVTDATPGSADNNYSPAGYVGGTTNSLLVTAAVGGTTLTGLSATGVVNGWTILLKNMSATDAITLTNQDAGSTAANRFDNTNSVSWSIAPRAAQLLTYITGVGWSPVT
jgi:hypothetical protein